jgi:ATP-dependent Lon protease
MTGELTLTGRVLPIGGLKEKIIAARRAHVNTLIFPEENLHDYEELPDYLKKDLSVHFVTHYDEVFKIAFPGHKAKSK